MSTLIVDDTGRPSSVQPGSDELDPARQIWVLAGPGRKGKLTLAGNRSVYQTGARPDRASLPIAATPDRGNAGSAGESITEVRLVAEDLDLASANPAPLSLDELDQADRYRRSRDRRRFVAGRSWLRSVLAEELGCASADVRFRYGPFGKPEISWPNEAPYFSLAHSENVAVLAVDPNGSVGMDIERLPGAHDPAVAALVLSRSELAYVASSDDQNRSFLECWTRKEAFAKLGGRGLERRLTEMTLSGPDAVPSEHGVTIVDLACDGAIGALALGDVRLGQRYRVAEWARP